MNALAIRVVTRLLDALNEQTGELAGHHAQDARALEILQEAHGHLKLAKRALSRFDDLLVPPEQHEKPFGLLIGVQGEIERVFPADGRKFTLHEQASLIGASYVQHIYPLGGHMVMVVDEEGLENDSQPNARATRMCQSVGIMGNGLWAHSEYLA